MKYSLILVITFLMISPFRSSAADDPSIVLSNYTFGPGQVEIAEIRSLSGPGKFKLIGKRTPFYIRENKLFADNKKIQPVEMFYDITVEGLVAGKKIAASFRLVKDEFIRNGVIAHRGAWKNTGVPENSIAALDHAIKLGCEGSEFDVHMSADSVLVINHDATIQGIEIKSSEMESLKHLLLSNGEKLPELESYIKAGIEQNKTKLILEIKPAGDTQRAKDMVHRVMAMVRKLKAQAWIDYISFDYTMCREIRALDPFARVAYLNGDKSPDELATDGIWGLDYHFSVFQKNEGWIGEAKEKKLTINTWTVNDEKTLQWFLDKKIDFITTNEPELLLKLVTQQ